MNFSLLILLDPRHYSSKITSVPRSLFVLFCVLILSLIFLKWFAWQQGNLLVAHASYYRRILWMFQPLPQANAVCERMHKMHGSYATLTIVEFPTATIFSSGWSSEWYSIGQGKFYQQLHPWNVSWRTCLPTWCDFECSHNQWSQRNPWTLAVLRINEYLCLQNDWWSGFSSTKLLMDSIFNVRF